MAFISEIHYRNSVATSENVDEYVEVALSAADFARAGDFQIATYEQNGRLSDVITLSDLTPTFDASTGYYVYVFETITTDPNGGNGNAEAIALIDNSLPNPVLSFYDIGGGTSEITANAGTPAAGATSVNIPASNGQSIQFDINGNRIDGDLTPGTAIICFTAGTQIQTPEGPVNVEDLVLGQCVDTLVHGAQPVRWIAQRTLNAADLAAAPHLRPVRIPAGALGSDLPHRDLHVSPQHRILISDVSFDLYLGAPTCFVTAKALVAAVRDIHVDEQLETVSYVHFMCDRHEVVFADGQPCESLYAGQMAITALDRAQVQELFTLFPELRYQSDAKLAFPQPKGWEANVALQSAFGR